MRMAFTIVELLVAIAVIGILLSLIVPFILGTKSMVLHEQESVQEVQNFAYQGHQYLMFVYEGSSDVVHDPDCPCSRKAEHE